ncbi:hypothetical protein ABFS82_02G023600 [Erythranthe guttata]|nr:PREDICTED: uncharacterized protein At1g01500-like [Erythranthe guttata]|eukprot:XP_012836811.1 PREDICTED: uncharacterized protein At1g01500-like [Erythranthe guttata]
MNVNEEDMLISLREMEDSSEEELDENGPIENGHLVTRPHTPYHPSVKLSLPWLDLRVFYIRVSRCVINDPDHLTLNLVPLSRNTLLEVNSVRPSIYADGISTLLKKDRLDKRSEEVTFVSTDSIRMTGSVKFEVFNQDVLILSGTLELALNGNGFIGESKYQGQSWNMECDGFLLKGNQNNYTGSDSSFSPAIEVYVAGSFLGSPVILIKSLQLNNHRRKQVRKGMLESIPEYEAAPQSRKDDSSNYPTIQSTHYPDYKQQDEDNCSPYLGMEYLEGEDGELSWFNAGVRVGVGIGLSISLGVGIGVGLFVRTYQGTTKNLIRRLL